MGNLFTYTVVEHKDLVRHRRIEHYLIEPWHWVQTARATTWTIYVVFIVLTFGLLYTICKNRLEARNVWIFDIVFSVSACTFFLLGRLSRVLQLVGKRCHRFRGDMAIGI